MDAPAEPVAPTRGRLLLRHTAAALPAAWTPSHVTPSERGFEMKRLAHSLLAALLLVAAVSGAAAHEYKAGNLQIHHPAAKATLPGQPVGGGFFTIVNDGGDPDRLVSITSPVSDDVQLHTMTMENDVMQMRRLADGIDVPAGGSVKLEPGGLHVMFMGIKAPFKEGESFPATLNFEKAGPVDVQFNVEAFRPASQGEADSGTHKAH